MDILFEVEEQNQYDLMRFVGIVEGVPVGHVWLVYRSEHVAQLFEISLVDKEGGKLGLQEFAEAFFQYMKKQGCTELWINSENMDRMESLGFRLEEWDNSGWYPKYYFLRKL